MILDTSFLIDLLKNKKEAVELAASVEDREVMKTTSISVFEIYKDISNKDKLKRVGEFFDSLIILNFNTKSAKLAGDIFRELAQKGEEIDSEDCMIAAITKNDSEVLITRNTKHFNRIKNLNIRSY